MEKIIKKGSVVTKTLIWNMTDNETHDDISECQLTFNDESTIMYECDDVSELENEHKGIYELLEDGTYLQVEDWE